jgi:hypothetical protein
MMNCKRQILNRLVHSQLFRNYVTIRISSLWALHPNVHTNSNQALDEERSGLKEASDVTKYVTGNFPSDFFTVAQTCYCSEKKIFTRPDGCAALYKVFCNMLNKKTPAARQQFSVHGSI